MVSECMETSLPSKRERKSGQWEERDTRGEGNRVHPSDEATPLGTTSGNSQVFLPPHTPLPSPLSFALLPIVP